MKFSTIHLKFKIYVVARFWVPNFILSLITFSSNIFFYGCLPSISLYNIHSPFFMPMKFSFCTCLDLLMLLKFQVKLSEFNLLYFINHCLCVIRVHIWAPITCVTLCLCISMLLLNVCVCALAFVCLQMSLKDVSLSENHENL